MCRFETDKPFKCLTVPTYIAKDTSTCSAVSLNGEEVYPFHSACFSLADRTLWSCQAEAAQESSSCTWTYLSGAAARMKRLVFVGRFYDGLCLFPGSPGYEMAADWHPQSPEAATTTNTTTTTRPPVSPAPPAPAPPAPPPPAPPSTEHEGGSGGGWIFLFVLLMIGCCCYMLRACLMPLLHGGARHLPLIADARPGSEMSAA